MLNQYGLNVFPGTPRPPKGGTRGLLARADPRRCMRTIDCARRRGAGPAGAACPVDRRPVGAGVLAPRGRRRGDFCFVQQGATLDAANRAARQPSGLPTSAMRAGVDGPQEARRRGRRGAERGRFPSPSSRDPLSTFCKVFRFSLRFVLSFKIFFCLEPQGIAALFAAFLQKR